MWTEYSTEDMVKWSGFLQMKISAMTIFLQSDALCAKEENVWQAALKWAQYQVKHEKYASFDGNPPSKKKQKIDHDVDATQEKTRNLMKQICPFIRFGLMDGKFICQKIKPLQILTGAEISDILAFIQYNDDNCGKFNIKSRDYTNHNRHPAIPYELEMSSRLTFGVNT